MNQPCGHMDDCRGIDNMLFTLLTKGYFNVGSKVFQVLLIGAEKAEVLVELVFMRMLNHDVGCSYESAIYREIAAPPIRQLPSTVDLLFVIL